MMIKIMIMKIMIIVNGNYDDNSNYDDNAGERDNNSKNYIDKNNFHDDIHNDKFK